MSACDSERVVITGIGMATALAGDREGSWRAVKEGRRGARWLPSEFPHFGGNGGRDGRSSTQWAGAPAAPVSLPEIGLSARTVAAIAEYEEPVVRLAVATAAEALADASLSAPPERPERFGCVLGSSKGGLQSFARLWQQLREDSPSSETFCSDPNLWFHFWPNAAASVVSHLFGLRGAAVCPVAACATGLASVAYGADLIRDGRCDVVLAGSADASLHAPLLAAYRRMGVLARGFEEPSQAVRPFDRRRTGFLVGEGAGMLVLERWEHAKERGARPYAEWLGWAGATDAGSLTALDPDATTLAHLLRNLLQQTQLTSEEIDYINLHGTATRLNDLCETRAVKTAFGRRAKHLACSGLKGALGHLLGAAGSVELAATVLAMRDRMIPPTVNLEEPDDLCDLDYTPGSARTRRIENAVKISLGFGGHLVAAVLRSCPV